MFSCCYRLYYMNDILDILSIARCLLTQEAQKNETSAREGQIQVSYLIHIPRLAHLVEDDNKSPTL